MREAADDVGVSEGQPSQCLTAHTLAGDVLDWAFSRPLGGDRESCLADAVAAGIARPTWPAVPAALTGGDAGGSRFSASAAS